MNLNAFAILIWWYHRILWKLIVPTIEIQLRSQQPYSLKVVISLKTVWKLTLLAIEIHADSQ
jgi:hypothetical protein